MSKRKAPNETNYFIPRYSADQTQKIRELIMSDVVEDRAMGRCIAQLRPSIIKWIEEESKVRDDIDIVLPFAFATLNLTLGLAFHLQQSKERFATLIAMKEHINSCIDHEILLAENQQMNESNGNSTDSESG